MPESYDVVIVGGGITGTATLYALSKYTNLHKLALLEKYQELAHVNSHFNSNSQTLHFGDIETNFSLEKATSVKEASSLLAGFVEKFAKDSMHLSHKMVLAVGKKEVADLEERYDKFKILFPNLKLIYRDEISSVEPKVIEGRDDKEKVAALFSAKGYALNYQKVSRAFVQEAKKQDVEIEIMLGKKVLSVVREENLWRIRTEGKTLFARFIVFAAGPQSLIFAKKLGYGKDLGILPVAGSFYKACGLLKGKVYTMQIEKLPFAAIHGDPDVNNPEETRFGPTAKALPLLERHHWSTFYDFLKTSVFTLDGALSLLKIISDKTIFLYVLKNSMFDFPLIGKKLFIKEVKKIIPTIKLADLEYGHGLGGIRPQVVNTTEKKMEMGEAKIKGKGVIFDITPSPGASVCLENARKNSIIISDYLKDASFDEKRFTDDHHFEY